MTQIAGQLAKMQTTFSADTAVKYQLLVGNEQLVLNPLIGETLKFTFAGEIFCQNCNRKIKKSYSGGFCFPCAQKLAQCDLCFMKPELCHFDQGTCREPQWGLSVCMQDHIVYLANSSGLKVGITRTSQVPTRWMDQGATQALPIFRVKSRYQSGLVEVAFKQHISDRTDWRKMLKGAAEPLDLSASRDKLMHTCQAEIATLRASLGEDAIVSLTDEQPVEMTYPVVQYPTKVTALNLDKTPQIEGCLQGIKGQYLMFDKGVLNIRKYAGYQVAVEV